MNLKKLLLPIVLILCAATISSRANTYNFTGLPTGSYDGVSVNGFTFHGSWEIYGNDSVNAPLMEYYGSSHSVTFDAGSFNFASMSLGGLPWDDYSNQGGSLGITFKDINGTTILTDSFGLAGNNSFSNYTQNVTGVHEISFSSWYFWPRLASITSGTSNNVPDSASTLALLGGALAGLALMRRRR